MAITGTGPVLGTIINGADALESVTWGNDYTTDVGTLQPTSRQIKRGDAAWRAIAASEIVPDGLTVRFREIAFNEAAVGDAFYTEFVTAIGAELTPLELRTSVTDPHTGVTFFFVEEDGVTPESRQVGQHFLGDWFVIATPENPVRISNITPTFERGTGTIRRWRGSAVEGDLWINGSMLNPSRLARDENVSPNYGQGFSSYTYSATLNTPGRLEVNVDPGYTGAALVLSSDGDVLVKSKCYWLSYPPTAEEMGGANDNIGTITLNYACLTVRHSVPRARSLRPACAPSMKFATLDTTVDDIDLTKFVQLDQSALNPLTFKQYADRMKQISSYTFAFHDDNSRNVRAAGDVGDDFVLPDGYIANEKGYDRDEHRRFGEALCGALRAPTTGDNSAEERLRLIAGLVQYSLDAAADIYAGADRNTSGAGYGMGWASVVTLAYLALGYSWIASLRDVQVPNPATGLTPYYYPAHPSGNFPERPEFGVRSYGCVEDNRFMFMTEEYVGFPVMQVESTPGRSYPLAFQDADIGRPVWIISDSRFFLGSGSRIFRGSIDPRKAYHDMQGAMHAPIIAIYLMGGREAYNNDVPLLVIDRIRWLHNAGLTKTAELGFTGYTAAFASAFRNSITPALWAGMPERPRAPTVEGFLGDPTIVRVTPFPTLMTYGHEVTRHDLRYTTTQPSTTDYNEPIWTVLNDITFDPYYDITGLSFDAGTKIFVQHQYWTSEGRSGWSPSHRATSRWLLNEDGTRNRLLGPYEDPDGSQGAVVTSEEADVTNTILPSIVGSPTIGAELVFDRGEWAVVPWNWSQISWRVNGIEVATGDAWRIPTSGVEVGASITVAWTAENSSSSQSGTTSAVVVRESETFEVPLTASVMTLTNTSNPNDRTRYLNGVADGSHPVRRLGLLAMATTTGGQEVESQMMRLQTSSGTNVDSAVNNELLPLRYQRGSGGRVATVRFYDVESATTGGVRFAFWASPFRDIISGMCAFDLEDKWDLDNAWHAGETAVSEVDPDDPDTPFEFNMTIRNYLGKPRTVPEGSLIISTAVFGRSLNLSDELPVWSGDVSVLPGMELIGRVSASAEPRHMISVAAGIQAVSGPCEVTLQVPQTDSFYVVSTIVIPPK